MAVPHASLKVYEPLESFPEAEREPLLRAASVTTASAVVVSQSRGLAELFEDETADVIVVDGRTLVCPHRKRLRVLASLLMFRRMIPGEAAPAFMPEGEVERAVDELEGIREEHPSWRSHILTSTWEVPVRWFVAFDQADREIDLSVPSVRYRTSMRSARSRTRLALRAARAAMAESTVAELVSDLARWLDGFHDESIVELDYGALAAIVAPEDLEADRSADDIQDAVRSLLEGDLLSATSAYIRAAERWAPLAALERTN